MNQELNVNAQPSPRENVLAGIVGAFLFALAGGAMWFVIYMLGYLAGISGLVGVICAIKGYAIFSKKESIKGIVIASVVALVVMAIAWYFSLGYAVYDVFQGYYADGMINYSVSFFDAMRMLPEFFSESEFSSAAFRELAIGLVFCLIASGGYIFVKIRDVRDARVLAERKAQFAAEQAAAPTPVVEETTSEDTAAEEQSNSDDKTE